LPLLFFRHSHQGDTLRALHFRVKIIAGDLFAK